MSLKTKRLAASIAREIGIILEEDARNEIIRNVSVTDVTVDSDLTFAKVYFMTRLDDHDLVEKELNKASGFVRTELAHKLNLRSTPELKFVYDKSLDFREKIDEVIEKIHEDKNE